jgi:hypothetical protein
MMNFAKSHVFFEFKVIWLNKVKFIERQPLGAAPFALPPTTPLHSIQEFIQEATVPYSHKKQIRHTFPFLPLHSLHIMMK